MNFYQLTALLASRVMGWRVAPDRFLLGERQWTPRHTFQPARRASDAFRLLAATDADHYVITRTKNGDCSAQIEIRGVVAKAKESSEAMAITMAIARACGIEV